MTHAQNHSQPSVKRVYNLIILDESGSMESIRKPTINGFNELIQSIKHSMRETPEIEQWVSFYSFNGSGIREHLPVVHAASITELTKENYRPDNNTPLYDAIGLAVNATRKAIAGETDYSVLVTILTDGEENSSQEYTFQSVAALIQEMKSEGWVFTYIGANHDVEKTAFELNISNHLHFHANEEDTKTMFLKNQSSRDRYMMKLKTGSKDVQQGYFNEDDDKKL